MLSQDKFHKLCKYSLRLEKSFITNDVNNYTKYCSHLKHHIGGTNTNLDNMFEKLIEIIKEKQTDSSGNFVTFESLNYQNKALQDKVQELETAKETNLSEITKLNEQNIEFKSEKEELNKKILKYETIINTINQKLKIINNNFDLNINNEKYEEELNNALEQLIKKNNIVNNLIEELKNEINANENKIKILTEENIKLNEKIKLLENELEEKNKILEEKNKTLEEKNQALEEKDQVMENTKKEYVEEFKTKLKDILETIYGKSLADNIIKGANEGAT